MRNKKYMACSLASLMLMIGSEQAVSLDSGKQQMEARQLSIITTAKNSDQRLATSGTQSLRKGTQPTENEISVFVNTSVTFQTMLGFGGAITDASAEVFATL